MCVLWFGAGAMVGVGPGFPVHVCNVVWRWVGMCKGIYMPPLPPVACVVGSGVLAPVWLCSGACGLGL